MLAAFSGVQPIELLSTTFIYERALPHPLKIENRRRSNTPMWPSHVHVCGRRQDCLLGALTLLSDFLRSCAKIEGTSALLEDSVSLKCGLYGMGSIGFTIFARLFFFF